MDPNVPRPARKVGIADHLWELFEQMAQSMGSDRDALINQALFTFARLNGFIEPSAPPAPGAGPPSAKTNGVLPKQVAQGKPPPPVATVSQARRDEDTPRPSKLEEDPARREVAERVLETAAELERLIRGKAEGREDSGVEVPVPGSEEEAPADEEGGDEPLEDAGPSLYLMAEGGEMDKIGKERFVIGRGKHCDFVINSGKVSREHAVITKDGDQYFIEDLGSSNGTWFNKQRIKRRKIEDGDEYFICSEKIKLVMR